MIVPIFVFFPLRNTEQEKVIDRNDDNGFLMKAVQINPFVRNRFYRLERIGKSVGIRDPYSGKYRFDTKTPRMSYLKRYRDKRCKFQKSTDGAICFKKLV